MSKATKGKTRKGSSASELLLDAKIASKSNDFYNGLWVQVSNRVKNKVEIRKITKYEGGDKQKAILNEELTFEPDVGESLYTISELMGINDLQGPEFIVKKDGTSKSRLPLTENARKMDGIYQGYWVYVISGNMTGYVRRVKDYTNNVLVLDKDLPEKPNEGDKFKLLQHFFNNYIVFGIDFTNFLGMDFSALIDAVGGSFNFQFSSIICVVFCILFISMMTLYIKGGGGRPKKGLFIPGIGHMGPQQPLVIQMPMQTQPYPYKDSPFPRDT